LSFQHRVRLVQAQIVSVTDMRDKPRNRERTMRYSHCMTCLKPATATAAAGLAAGLLLAGGISTVPVPGAHAPGDAAASQPLAPGVASARLTSVDVPTQQPAPAGPKAIVITGNPGDGHGPRAVIITGSDPGPGQGPKAVVVTGGDPGNGNGPKTVVVGDNGGDGPGPKTVLIPGGGPPP
jgi:hypothetical protein